MNGSKARGICLENSQTRAITMSKSLCQSIPSCDRLSVVKRTQILNILIPSDGEGTTRLSTSRTSTGASGFVDDDTIGSCSSHESCAIREPGHARACGEGNVRESIADGAEEKREVTDEPAKSGGKQC